MRILGNSEYHFHVLGSAPPSYCSLHVSVAGGGDEVVALTRLELHLLGGRGEGSEGDGEVHQVPGLITYSNDPGVGLDDCACVELLLLDAVDDVPLRGVDPTGTDDVHLIILVRVRVLVNLDDILIVSTVTSTEYWVGDVPVDVKRLASPGRGYH